MCTCSVFQGKKVTFFLHHKPLRIPEVSINKKKIGIKFNLPVCLICHIFSGKSCPLLKYQPSLYLVPITSYGFRYRLDNVNKLID